MAKVKVNKEENDFLPENPFLRFFYHIGHFFHKLNNIKGLGTFLSGFLCIVIGLVIGLILLVAMDWKNSLEGFKILLTYGFSNTTTFARVLYQATPMMISGLAIGFAFKLGLFNIGITGQVTAGAFVSIIIGLLGMPWYVCILAAILAGAIIGFIPGFLKAKFNVNEVLSGIMLNWIVYYIIGLLGALVIPRSMKDKITPSNLNPMPKAACLPSIGLDNILPGVTLGIVISLVIIFIFQIILNHTTFGFELKLTGSNRHAAKYAGMNQTRNIILAITISGALAGLCGYMTYANPLTATRFRWDSGNNTLIGDGFTGISVSLIAQNSPIGCIFSSLLLTLINSSQSQMKLASSMYNAHFTELLKAVIIYVASFSSLFVILLRKASEHYDIKQSKRRAIVDHDALTEGLLTEEPSVEKEAM